MGSAPKTSVFRHFSLFEVAKNTLKVKPKISQTKKKIVQPLKTVIDMSTTKSIEGLLEKPVYMMTGEEYLELTHYALANSPNAANRPTQAGQKALGVHALAVELGCSESTIYALMRAPREEDGSNVGGGVLREAIVSRIGRRIVFDVDKARKLADEYQATRK